MNIQELELLSRNVNPIGDKFLDNIFQQDTTSVYYRFLYRLVERINPKLVVELGVCKGGSTAHMAAARFETRVIAVDTAPFDVSHILDRYKNIDLIINESCSIGVLGQVHDKSVDICFIDTLHQQDLVTEETRLWLPKMKIGGIILFDDISLNEGMIKFWNKLNISNRISLPHLHWSGFGAAIIE